MKKTVLFTALTALLLLAGCYTTKISTPKQHPEKYALQIIRIEVPSGSTKTPDPPLGFSPNPETVKSPATEALLNHPAAKISEFPIVYAAIGETAINDQTETIAAPQTYESKTDTNGVVSIVYDDGTAKIGKYTEWTIIKIENGTVTADLWFYEQSLQGMQKYPVAPATETQEAVTASMPVFKKQEMKTQITLAPETWISMGGITGTKKEGDESITTTTYFAIRILPPQKQNPHEH